MIVHNRNNDGILELFIRALASYLCVARRSKPAASRSAERQHGDELDRGDHRGGARLAYAGRVYRAAPGCPDGAAGAASCMAARSSAARSTRAGHTGACSPKPVRSSSRSTIPLAPATSFPASRCRLPSTRSTGCTSSRAKLARAGNPHLFVAGEEAGGNLAAALALMARDQQTPPLAGQILLSPMLDPCMATCSMRQAEAGPVGCQWADGWHQYLGSARQGRPSLCVAARLVAACRSRTGAGAHRRGRPDARREPELCAAPARIGCRGPEQHCADRPRRAGPVRLSRIRHARPTEAAWAADGARSLHRVLRADAAAHRACAALPSQVGHPRTRDDLP